MKKCNLRLFLAAAFFLLTISAKVQAADDPLPSWNDGATKQSITAFVEKVTKEGSSDFVKARRSHRGFR